jgi:hypothetical protein
MKPFILFLLICSSLLIYVKTKVKLTINKKLEMKSLLRNRVKEPKELIYITLLEGSKNIYALCQSICGDLGEITLYSESTNYPDYGVIFRCQCGSHYTPWYNLENLNEMCLDILKGDSLFNDYFNLLGYDTSDCKCSPLKDMLSKMLL